MKAFYRWIMAACAVCSCFLNSLMGLELSNCRDWICDSTAVQALIDSNGYVDIDVASLVRRNSAGRVDTLDIQYNSFTRLTASVGQLSELKVLQAFNNQINIISPAISRLKNLEILLVSKNHLENLPDAISACSALKVLWANTNRLKAIPEFLGEIKSLREVTFADNELKNIPASISNLDSLEYLDIGHNDIRELPEGFTGLKGIRHLVVDQNRLCNIPESYKAWLDRCSINPEWRSSQKCGSKIKWREGKRIISQNPSYTNRATAWKPMFHLSESFSTMENSIFTLSGVRYFSSARGQRAAMPGRCVYFIRRGDRLIK